MPIDKSEEVNEDEERGNARQQRGAWLRARLRAHPVLFSIGAVLVLYAFALGGLLQKHGRLHGLSVFLWAGIIALVAFVFLMLRLWMLRRTRRARSNWT